MFTAPDLTRLAKACGAPLLVLALCLTACAPRDDGMGELWKGVSCVQKRTC